MGEILSRNQRHEVLARLRARWPVADGDWWHPIDACGGAETLLLETAWLEREADLTLLRRLLTSGTPQFVWQLIEGTPHWDDDPANHPFAEQDYLLDIDEARLAIGASETIWVPTSLTWLIYTGHDQNSYFVGSQAIGAVQTAWPNWSSHIWTDPFYTRPPSDHA